MDITIRPLGAALSSETDLDDGSVFLFDWTQTDWGEAAQPDPEEQATQKMSVIHYPGPESWKRRELKIVCYRICSSHNDKRFQASQLAALFQGRRTIRRHGWEMDVVFLAPREVGESTKTPLLIGFEVVGFASPPFWRAVDSLSAIQWESTLYPDYGIPPQEVFPPYIWIPGGGDGTPYAPLVLNPGGGSHLTFNNWGSAFVYPSISITGGPTSTTIYLKGPGNFRAKVTTNGSGAATLADTGRLYLPPGYSGIRLENAAGTALDLSSYANIRIDFGSTKLRFL